MFSVLGRFKVIELKAKSASSIGGESYVVQDQLNFINHSLRLSPELCLRRPPESYPDWRLDYLLQKKAKQGVKIFIIVYKEVRFLCYLL